MYILYNIYYVDAECIEKFLLYNIIIAVKVCVIIPCKAEEPSCLVLQLQPPDT